MVTPKSLKLGIPRYSLTEEIINSITHGLGAIFGVIALALFFTSPQFKGVLKQFCFSVYGVSLTILFAVSAIYHALKADKAKGIFRKLDHCAIFLLIAGTYTPISLLLVKGITGMVIVSVVWLSAILGIILNSIDVNKFAKFSFACYLSSGWAVIFAIKPLIKSLSSQQLFWLFIGGLMYTVGAVIYVVGKKIKFMHSVWHVFVLGGSLSHFMIFMNFWK